VISPAGRAGFERETLEIGIWLHAGLVYHLTVVNPTYAAKFQRWRRLLPEGLCIPTAGDAGSARAHRRLGAPLLNVILERPPCHSP
jgi:hypothetical protein